MSRVEKLSKLTEGIQITTIKFPGRRIKSQDEADEANEAEGATNNGPCCVDNIEIVFAIRDAVVDDYVVSSPPNISAEHEVGQYRWGLSTL